MQEVKIKRNWVEDSAAYAKAVTVTNVDAYKKRGQSNAQKIEQQNMNGKIAELVAYSYLSGKLPDLSTPDLNVYTARKKNWDKDLKSKYGSFGVKSQTMVEKTLYGESWVFQNEDTGIFEDTTDDNYVVLVLLDLKELKGYIKSIVKVKWLLENKLFKPMKLIHLKSKKAVYFSDLEKYGEEIWQLQTALTKITG